MSIFFLDRDGHLHCRTTEEKYGLPFSSRVQSCTGKSQCQFFRFLFWENELNTLFRVQTMATWRKDFSYRASTASHYQLPIVQIIRITVERIYSVLLTLAEARFSASSLRLVAGKNTTLSMVWISSSCTTQRIRRDVNNSSAVLSENGDKWQWYYSGQMSSWIQRQPLQ